MDACTATSEAGSLLVATAASAARCSRRSSMVRPAYRACRAGEGRLDRQLGLLVPHRHGATRCPGELLLERVLQPAGADWSLDVVVGPAFSSVSAVACFMPPSTARAKPGSRPATACRPC